VTTTLTPPLDEIADELTASGYSVHAPDCIKIINARGALSDLTITESGSLTWEYRSCEGNHIDPAQLTGMVSIVLDQPGTDTAHWPAGAALTSAVGQAVSGRGLEVSLNVLDADTTLDETFSELTITSPAKPERGTVRVTDDGALYWHCHTDDPDNALTHGDIAATLTRALATAGHTPSDLP
jgi:hypothetical protein